MTDDNCPPGIEARNTSVLAQLRRDRSCRPLERGRRSEFRGFALSRFQPADLKPVRGQRQLDIRVFRSSTKCSRSDC